MRAETTRKIKIDTLTGQSPSAAVQGRRNFGRAAAKRARHKWIARKFVRRQRADIQPVGDSKKDRIFAPRNSVKNGRKSCRARCDATTGKSGGAREKRGGGWWTPLLKSAAANDATNGGTIRLSPIKYRGSAQNISVVSRTFLRRTR